MDALKITSPLINIYFRKYFWDKPNEANFNKISFIIIINT